MRFHIRFSNGSYTEQTWASWSALAGWADHYEGPLGETVVSVKLISL